MYYSIYFLSYFLCEQNVVGGREICAGVLTMLIVYIERAWRVMSDCGGVYSVVVLCKWCVCVSMCVCVCNINGV